MRFKLLFKELIYKFLVDYISKNSIYKIKNIKYIDLLLNNLISKGFRFYNNISLLSSLYLKNKKFNSVIILIIILFLIIWGSILIKNICFAYIRFITLKLFFLRISLI